MAENQYSDEKELLEKLQEKGVEFMLVGSYAVAFYGFNRFTKDLDLYAYPSQENQQKIAEALEDLVYDASPIQSRPLDTIEPIRVPGYSCGTVDILTYLPNRDPDGLFQRAASYSYRGLRINIISYNDLIDTKLEALRDHDIHDIQELEKQRKFEGGAENKTLSEFLNQYYQRAKEGIKKKFNIGQKKHRGNNRGI